MSQFIELTDYDASIHREILDALTREDESIVEICEDRTLAEMRGYLSRRYDCDRLFAATGRERNQLVLMMAVDITGVPHLLHPQPAQHVLRPKRPLRPGKGMAGGGGGREHQHRRRTAATAGRAPDTLRLYHKKQP